MTLIELAEKLRALIEKAAVSLDDEDALEGVELFPAWKAGEAYAADQRIRHEMKLYRCVQAHTSQAGWEPDKTPALWTEVAKPGEIPVWKQPTGAQDAFQKGDKVKYPDAAGDVWISTADNNVWEPGVYGWEKTT
ncbi:MAG: alpha-amylase [Stomatobaculum sp.]|nr:alpha-amylase [Stomatobaculum sp.]MBR7058213.1 alpha-amylase [Stomatobaculum sp.]